MRTTLRTTAAGLAALLLLLALACGGNSNNEATSKAPVEDGAPAGDSTAGDDGEPGAAVSAAVEALGRSAEDFQEEVESLRGTMIMEMSANGISFGIDGDFAFNAPDQMHMKMEFTGDEGQVIDFSELGSIEMLLLGDKMYMYVPFLGGWTVATLDELGVDAQQYRDMLNNHSPFDYSDLVASFGDSTNVQDLGTEDIDGSTYRHYRMESDLASLMNALAGAFGDDVTEESLLPEDGASGPIAADIWLDSDTMLPYKLTAEGSFAGDTAGGSMEFSLAIVIEEYNGYVTMPEPPGDARPFSELGQDTE
jgi:outer membrane lipoprotein-sorting protein